MGIAPALAEVMSWATSDTRGLRISDRGIRRFEQCFLTPADVAAEKVVDFGLGPQSIGFSRPFPLRRKPGMSSLLKYAAKALRLLVRQRCPIDEVHLNALTGGGGDAQGGTPAARTRYLLLNSSSIRAFMQVVSALCKDTESSSRQLEMTLSIEFAVPARDNAARFRLLESQLRPEVQSQFDGTPGGACDWAPHLQRCQRRENQKASQPAIRCSVRCQ